MENVSNCAKCGNVLSGDEKCYCGEEKTLKRMIKKVKGLSDEFWGEYWNEDSMSNDLLDTATQIINLQEGIISSLQYKVGLIAKGKEV